MSETLVTQLQTIPGGKNRTLVTGAFLFHQGDAVESVYLVQAGGIRLLRHQQDGSRITVQRSKSGEVLAEASLYSHLYHCDAIADKATSVYVLPRQLVLQRLQVDTGFARDWMMYLAREVQRARFRSELLSLKTVASRLDAWLNWQGDGLPVKGERKILAEQLGVSPEALYREISKRQLLHNVVTKGGSD